jgi:hypothetical protein
VPIRAYLLLSILACPVVTGAQSGYISSYSYSYSGTPLPNLPYTATFESKTVQTLADGTTVTTTVKTREARDSHGRTFHQVTRALPDGSQLSNTFVTDLVDHTAINWSSGSTVAMVDHLPDSPPIRRQTAAPPTKQQAQPEPAARPSQQKESLGSKTILGVVAEGTRVTRVISAGSEGNDRPITVVYEAWRSPDLGIMLSTSRDDPRNGHITQEVTELDRGEPDPALFQPPAGYTLQDRDRPQ